MQEKNPISYWKYADYAGVWQKNMLMISKEVHDQ